MKQKDHGGIKKKGLCNQSITPILLWSEEPATSITSRWCASAFCLEVFYKAVHQYSSDALPSRVRASKRL